MKCDVFISFKHSDEKGELTQDCQIASRLYKKLCGMGFSVFFSPDSLEKIGSSRFKADIDDALDTARIMIVVLSRPEYASSHWVQYEWDSFYSDYLSGVRKEANLFTLTSGFSINELPRTLRNVQHFDYSSELDHLCAFVSSIMPQKHPVKDPSGLADDTHDTQKSISIITGRQITIEDIREAVMLDMLVYDDIYHVDTKQCEEWFEVNPDIYVMARDDQTGRIIAYVNISPVTDECYERIKRGDFIDTGITADMILSYDMPFPYNVYFFSIVIHPEYQNSDVFVLLFNAVVKKFITLGEHDVFVHRMIADAVTKNGEKFCNLFGMKKIKNSDHESTLYEVTMIPPQFRVISKMSKLLFDYYQRKYEEAPYLFSDSGGSTDNA